MTTISVAIPVAAGAVNSGFIDPSTGRPNPHKLPKVKLISEQGDQIVIPFAPSEMTMDNIAPNWGTVERPGKTDLLLYNNDALPQVTFTAFIAAEDQVTNPLASVESWLTGFRAQLGKKLRWRFTYGDQVDKYWWRITDASIRTQLRSPVDNSIAVATLDIQLTQASDIAIRTGPITGGMPLVVATTAATTSATGGGGGSGATTTSGSAPDGTVWYSKGETGFQYESYYSIALKKYGNTYLSFMAHELEAFNIARKTLYRGVLMDQVGLRNAPFGARVFIFTSSEMLRRLNNKYYRPTGTAS